MSFSDEIIKSISNKIALVEYDLPVEVDEFSNYEAGIWYKKITPGVVTISGSDGLTGYYTDQNTYDYKNIASLKIGAIDYIKVTSLSQLRSQNESFYYDQATTMIYFHFTDFEWPLDKVVLAGAVQGFLKEIGESAYYNNIYYEPRVKNIPGLSQKKDPLFFGVLAFQSGSISFINNDGFFDNIIDLSLYRQPCRVKFGFTGIDYSEFENIFSGYVERYALTFDDFSLSAQDIRKNLSRSIPVRTFQSSEFPDIDEDNINKPKPLAYGSVKNAPVICVNENESSPTNYEFLIMDTTDYSISSVSNVYVDNELLGGAHWSVDLDTGILSIASAQVEDNLEDVSCDFVGASETNGIAIIQDLMLKYADLQFISSNFSITQWNTAKADSRDIGLYIDKDIKVIKQIEEICKSIDCIFYVTPDGKYSAKIFDADRTPRKTIESYEWISDPKITIDESRFLSSVKILYNQDYAKGTYTEYLNDNYENEVLRRYKAYNQKEIKTLLATESDAMAISETVMALSKEVKEIATRTVKMQHYDLEIGDFIIASPDTRYGEADNLRIYEIISKNIDFNNFTITLEMRYVKDYEVVETVYSQGYLYYDDLYFDRLYGTTRRD